MRQHSGVRSCFTTNILALSRQIHEPAATPIEFDEIAADTSVRFDGFYLFHAF